MKKNLTNFFLLIVLIFLIFLTISNACVYFKPSSSFSSLRYSSFEPFSEEKEGIAGMGGSTVDEPSNPDSLLAQLTPSTTPSSKEKKVESFTNLSGSPYSDEKPIDVFSGTPGSASCDGISSNLTNSKGGLCLSDMQQKLLKTRGGNATGGGFQF